jgi:hypothetical protein
MKQQRTTKRLLSIKHKKRESEKEGNITFSAIVQDLCLCLSLLVETYQLDNN